MKKVKWLFVIALMFFCMFSSDFSIMAEETELEIKSNSDFKYVEQNDGTISILECFGLLEYVGRDPFVFPSEIDGKLVTRINCSTYYPIEVVIPDSIIYIEKDTLKNVLCVYANPNSYARKYADEHDIKFVCIEHTNIIYDAEIPATCTKSGKTAGSRCADCGTVISGYNYISALGHKAVCIRVESTCSQEGYEYWCCERCHEDMPEYGGYASFPKIAHKFDEGIITINPAVTHTGLKTYTCTVCGAITTKIIPSKPFPKEGSIITISNNLYKVTKRAYVDGTVEYKGTSNSKNTIIIPSTIVFDGITYNVTSISKNAFKNNKKLKKVTIGNNIKTINSNAFNGCKNLKTITIKSTKLSYVGKNAFKSINKKAKIKVPSSKLAKYKILLANKGQKSTMKITK